MSIIQEIFEEAGFMTQAYSVRSNGKARLGVIASSFSQLLTDLFAYLSDLHADDIILYDFSNAFKHMSYVSLGRWYDDLLFYGYCISLS